MNFEKIKNKIIRNKIKFGLLVAICLTLAFCDGKREYFIPKIEGWVIDKDTKQPIDGAVLVVERSIEYGIHSSHGGFLQYQDAISDEKGYYNIPKLGEVKVKGHINGLSPNIAVFKAGYKLEIIHNVADFDEEGFKDRTQFRWNQHSIWDGKKIELEKYEGTDEEYIEDLEKWSRLFNDYSRVGRSFECSWIGIEIPKWYREINKELMVYDKNIDLLVEKRHKNKKGCEKWDLFFQEYSK